MDINLNLASNPTNTVSNAAPAGLAETTGQGELGAKVLALLSQISGKKTSAENPDGANVDEQQLNQLMKVLSQNPEGQFNQELISSLIQKMPEVPEAPGLKTNQARVPSEKVVINQPSSGLEYILNATKKVNPANEKQLAQIVNLEDKNLSLVKTPEVRSDQELLKILKVHNQHVSPDLATEGNKQAQQITKNMQILEILENAENLENAESLVNQNPAAKFKMNKLLGQKLYQQSQINSNNLNNPKMFQDHQNISIKSIQEMGQSNPGAFKSVEGNQISHKLATQPHKAIEMADTLFAENRLSLDKSQSIDKPEIKLQNIEGNSTQEIVDKIAELIKSKGIGSKNSLEVVVNHETLGNFSLKVKNSSTVNGAIDVNFSSLSEGTRDFFLQNQHKISQALSDGGIKLADIRFEIGMNTNTKSNQLLDKDSSGQNLSQNNAQGEQKEFKDQSSRQQSQRDAERRKDLWEMFKEGKAA